MNFLHDDSLKFPTLTQHNLKSGRCYKVEAGPHKGQLFPSITRVLGQKPKPQLEAWKKRLGPAEAARQSAIATVQGSSLHKTMECYLNNEPEMPRIMPNVADLWQHLHKWLDKNIRTVYAQEQDVASHQFGVAGRLDLLVGLDDDTIAVVDAKTSKRSKRDEWLSDYFLQGTFYALAVFENTGRAVKRILFPICYGDPSNPTAARGLQVFETSPGKHYKELLVRVKDFYTTYHQEKPVDTKAAS